MSIMGESQKKKCEMFQEAKSDLSTPAAQHEGWMVRGQETVFCWVPVPYLTMLVGSVAPLLITY